MPVEPLFPLIVRAGIAALFAGAAIHKLCDWRRAGAVIASYRLFPPALGGVAATGVIALELAVSAGVLASASVLHGAAALLLAYAAAIGFNILCGNDNIDCGCLAFGARAPRLTWAMVARNAVIAVLAEGAATANTLGGRPMIWIDFLSLAAALAVLAMLYAALEAAIGLSGRSAK